MKKKATIFRIFSILWILQLAISNYAQVSQTIETVNGQKFYMHRVEKGQTLFSISKLYQCDINDILSSNAGAESGIRENQVLKIPVSRSAVSSQQPSIPALTPSPGISKEPANFFLHEVQRRETLYSIAKLYHLDVNEIVAINPGSEDGLKRGHTLKIPIKPPPSAPSVVLSGNNKHIVQPGETLYAISRQYHVPVDSLLKFNPEIGETLKLGTEISLSAPATMRQLITKIPVAQNSGIAISGDLKKDRYSISLMLPFYADTADSTGYSEKEILQRQVAIDIYRGVLMAKDTVAQQGLNASIRVYDIEDDALKVKNLLDTPEMKATDIVIGPAFKASFEQVASWGKKNGVHVVCPVPLSNRVLLSSSNSSKAYPGLITQWGALGTFVATHYPSARVITINTSDIDDIKLLHVFNRSFLKERSDSTIEWKAVNRSAAGIAKLIDPNKTNIIVAPTQDRLLITTLFQNLSGDNIIVYGMESWENMSLIESEQRNQFHLHYPKAIFLDYTHPETQSWVESYRKKFKSEPTDYAALGYNLMLYYGKGLLQFGRDFPNHFQEMSNDGLMGMTFDYLKTGNESGFENQCISIIGTDTFQLTPEKGWCNQ